MRLPPWLLAAVLPSDAAADAAAAAAPPEPPPWAAATASSGHTAAEEHAAAPGGNKARAAVAAAGLVVAALAALPLTVALAHDRDLAVAAQYGVSGGTLLLKIKVDSVMQIGASLEFLTAFPGEAEVCFPPLTYLQPTGRTQEVRIGDKAFHVVEVEPHLA